MVRNAAALSKAGHEVFSVTPVFEKGYIGYDEKLLATEAWKYMPVSMLDKNGKIRAPVRIIRKLAFALASRLAWPALGSQALVYGAGAVKRILDELDGDLYLAQQQATLPLVAQVAIAKGKPYACDIEDILTESSSEPVALLSAIEKRYLKQAAVVSTMSVVAADYLDRHLALDKKVMALHNCPDLQEREGVKPPARNPDTKPSIYWFGQTLGSHSMAVELIEANASVGHPFRIALRGRANEAYLKKILEVVDNTGSMGLVEILPIVDNSKMVSEAAKHDVLFGSQPSEQLFHQLAVGNKVFTGLLAGCVLLVTDTIAHKELQQDLSDCMYLAKNNVNALGTVLKQLASDPARLLQMRKAAWDSGTARYHWGRECLAWTAAMNEALKGQP